MGVFKIKNLCYWVLFCCAGLTVLVVVLFGRGVFARCLERVKAGGAESIASLALRKMTVAAEMAAKATTPIKTTLWVVG